MYNWFQCKVKYGKTLENGSMKKVTETYLVDALSFTEAEARMTEEAMLFCSGEFSVSDIRRVKYSDSFIHIAGDRYYKAKLYFISLDEKSGTEKQTAVNMLVQSGSLKQAVEVIEKEMSRGLVDYRIVSVIETPIMDVFPYNEKKQKSVEGE